MEGSRARLTLHLAQSGAAGVDSAAIMKTLDLPIYQKASSLSAYLLSLIVSRAKCQTQGDPQATLPSLLTAVEAGGLRSGRQHGQVL